METELLRSKSEMMLLNNQLLEAAQKRLELSLELEAWKVSRVGVGDSRLAATRFTCGAFVVLAGGHAAVAAAAASSAAAGGAEPEENISHGHPEEEQGAHAAAPQLPGNAGPRLARLAGAQPHPEVLWPGPAGARPGRARAHLEGQVEEGQRGRRGAALAGGAPAQGQRRRLPGGLARLTPKAAPFLFRRRNKQAAVDHRTQERDVRRTTK